MTAITNASTEFDDLLLNKRESLSTDDVDTLADLRDAGHEHDKETIPFQDLGDVGNPHIGGGHV